MPDPGSTPPGAGPWSGLDRLAVLGVEGFGHHGVFEHERREGQVFVVDLALFLDTRPAARSDDLQDTVDYGTLVAKVKDALESDPVDLVETLAERVAALCLEDPRVQSAQVTMHKPHAPIASTFADVTLTITRTRPAPSPTEPPEPS